jgi:hypothetical protein
MGRVIIHVFLPKSKCDTRTDCVLSHVSLEKLTNTKQKDPKTPSILYLAVFCQLLFLSSHDLSFGL